MSNSRWFLFCLTFNDLSISYLQFIGISSLLVSDIKIATSLPSAGGNHNHYSATKGEDHTITCLVDGDAQDVTWLDDGLEAVSQDTISEIYQDVNDTAATLHISDKADYRVFEDFTCSIAESNITIFLSVEGGSCYCTGPLCGQENYVANATKNKSKFTWFRV